MLETDSAIALAVGTGAVPLAELVGFRNGEYSVEAAMVRELVDSAMTSDPRYTPTNAKRAARKLDTQAMYESWRKAYRRLRKQRPQYDRRMVLAADCQARHRRGLRCRDDPQTHEKVKKLGGIFSPNILDWSQSPFCSCILRFSGKSIPKEERIRSYIYVR